MIIQLDNSYYPYHIGSFEASTVLNHSQQWKVLPMPLPTELSTPAESWEQVNPHRHQRHRACWWYPSRGNPFLWKGRLRKFHKTFDQVSPSLSHTLNQSESPLSRWFMFCWNAAGWWFQTRKKSISHWDSLGIFLLRIFHRRNIENMKGSATSTFFLKITVVWSPHIFRYQTQTIHTRSSWLSLIPILHRHIFRLGSCWLCRSRHAVVPLRSSSFSSPDGVSPHHGKCWRMCQRMGEISGIFLR